MAGFDTPTINPSAKTFLQAVQDVSQALGVTKPSDLTTSPTKHTLVAMQMVNQALYRIWYAAQWSFRYRFIFMTMTDKVFLYSLPSDFDEAGASVMRPNDLQPFAFIDYHKLVQLHPGLSYPDATTLAGEGGTYAAEMEAIVAEDANLGGIPSHWTLVGDYMGLFPIPWSDTADATDYAEKDRIMVGYYGTFAPLTAAATELPVPFSLYGPLLWLATAYAKQTFGAPDAPADEQRGEQQLQVAIARQSSRGDITPSVVGPTQW